MEEESSVEVSDKIHLEEIRLSHSSDIFRTIDGQREYLGKWLPFVETTRALKDTQAFIKSVIETPAEKRELVFAIFYEGEFAGIIGTRFSDKVNRKTEVGYWLSETMQGKGIITLAVKSLVNILFNRKNINRIQIKCATGNLPSQNVAKRAGFIFEGVERDGELLSGEEFTDLKIYSKLKKEYEKPE